MGYWKRKVLPRIKKYFHQNEKKRAAEAIKSLDRSKEYIKNEIEEKAAQLKPKVMQIYSESQPQIKTLLKEPTEEQINKHAKAIPDLLRRLSESGCPGASALKDATDKYGVDSLLLQITFLLKGISVFVGRGEPFPIVKDVYMVATETGNSEEKIGVRLDEWEERAEAPGISEITEEKCDEPFTVRREANPP